MKRRHYLVKKGYQGRFIFTFLCVALTGALASIYLFDWLASKKIAALLFSMRLPAGRSGRLLLDEMLVACGVSCAIIFLGTILAVYLQTKRAKGPITRIAKEALNMADGDLTTPVSLRRGDEFQEVVPPMNRLKSWLRARFVAATAIANGLEGILAKGGSSPVAQEEIERLLNEVKRELEYINRGRED